MTGRFLACALTLGCAAQPKQEGARPPDTAALTSDASVAERTVQERSDAPTRKASSGTQPRNVLNRELRAVLASAHRLCSESAGDAGQSDDLAATYACLCRRLCAVSVAESSADRTLRWPLPGTVSGSTESGLVPLGPTFDIVISASGRVSQCGVSDAPPVCGAD